MVSLGDPVYLVLMLAMLVAMAFLASLPVFAFGQELRLIRDQGLALAFGGGCMIAALGALTAVTSEFRRGTAAVLLSRPVSGWCVVSGKFLGLAAAVGIFQLTATVACLWSTRIINAENAEVQAVDVTTLLIYFGSIVAALALVGLKHYLFGGWYVWQANGALCACFTGGFVLSAFLAEHGGLQSFGANVDWKTAYGCLLLLLAQWSFLAVLVPLAVVLDAAGLLVAAGAVFGLGLISQFLLATLMPAGLSAGAPWWRYPAAAVSALVPNWQAFWVSDYLADLGSGAPWQLWQYVLTLGVQVAASAVFWLLLAAWLLNRRECAGDEAAQEE